MDLLSSYLLGCSLESLSDEGATLLGVTEMLAMEDPKFPVFLDKSVNQDSVIVERGPEDGSKHGRRSASWFSKRDDAAILYRRANLKDNFPRCINHFVVNQLGVADIGLWA